jgi:DNA-binding transcriptional MerR regulator
VKGRKFRLETKLVAMVRYYERMYLITDESGIRVFTGNDEKTAKLVLRTLNGYRSKKSWKKKKR